MKKIIKFTLVLLGLVLLVLCGMLIFLSVTDYQPDAMETLVVKGTAEDQATTGNLYSLYTWNIGYAGLGDEEDFFLDGGQKVMAKDVETVEGYLKEVLNTIEGFDSDFLMLQEVDIDSKRSFNINQLDQINSILDGHDYVFAKNYDVKFVPIPWPPMGKVKAGLATYSQSHIESAERVAFKSNYSWPQNTIMLDRCFLVTRIPLNDKDKDLVLINAHFSAYDDGSQKEEQLQTIKDYVLDLYDQGHYVVLGGDWNQTFDVVDHDQYMLYEEGDIFKPSIISSDWLEEGWTFGVNDNAPTYRLLHEAYDPSSSQVGVIDGFLLSPNVKMESVEVMDLGFKSSDHNPVKIIFSLQ